MHICEFFVFVKTMLYAL